MKMSARAVAVALLGAAAVGANGEKTQNRAVTKVVKLLEQMLEKSKADADKDRVIYAKFKCYCDSQTAKKAKEVDDLSSEIAQLQSRIEELMGSTGSLSTECAQLKTDMATNEQARETATKLREEENASFLETEADLVAALEQMENAIDTLSEVGADQTISSGADHAMFMAKKASFVSINKDKVMMAVKIAKHFLPAEHQSKVMVLLQGNPGTYSAVSGEVVGILKNMRDTFTANLATARENEKAQKAAYDKLMKVKTDEYNEMSELYDEKQGGLGGNDDELAARRDLLAEDEEQKATKEKFLEELAPICEARKKEYEQRTALRANEDASIAEALAILNSDAAFATFGKVSATTTGGTSAASFLQLASVQSHDMEKQLRQQVQNVLNLAADKDGSLRLAQIAAKVAAENPFSTVLKEIDAMVATIAEEGKVDKEKLDFCIEERKTKNEEKDMKSTQITDLTTQIDELSITISEPQTGLKDTIVANEASLVQNGENQASATESRNAENAAYKSDIATLVDSEDLLARAIKVLNQYYSQIGDYHEEEKREAATLSGEGEAVPDTFEDDQGYKGQSGKGNKAIEMIEFILEETKKEEKEAHSAEEAALKEYNELMTSLKDEENTLKTTLANLRATLAEKEKEKADAENLKAQTEEEKVSIEAYLQSIKAGCDFIEEKFETREERRASETAALNKATELLKDTPAYKAAVAAQDLEDLGDCKDVCTENAREHVKCKACLADVEIPGYCAGHPDTEGC
eukprot:TRINITY_DN1596_c0_g1_i5.p1 TRINITY_DN1596_c0_g1~~TRINITY_DN1596_c0_g1_i5.p1  ORF type:complete len:780 (+),score=277.93 TRINITY_DN1596_c0_g1_i5:84-2342(+)